MQSSSSVKWRRQAVRSFYCSELLKGSLDGFQDSGVLEKRSYREGLG